MERIQKVLMAAALVAALGGLPACEPAPVPASDLQPQLFFSPNGDGIGDTWEIKGIESHPTYRVQVFDPYGNLLVASKPFVPWDGRRAGQPVPEGGYAFTIADTTGHAVKSGTVTLLR